MLLECQDMACIITYKCSLLDFCCRAPFLVLGKLLHPEVTSWCSVFLTGPKLKETEKVVFLWPVLHSCLLWVSRVFHVARCLPWLVVMKEDLTNVWWFLECFLECWSSWNHAYHTIYFWLRKILQQDQGLSFHQPFTHSSNIFLNVAMFQDTWDMLLPLKHCKYMG